MPIIARPTPAVESHDIFGIPTPFPDMEAVALLDGHGVEVITTLEGADLPLPILRGEGAMEGKEAR